MPRVRTNSARLTSPQVTATSHRTSPLAWEVTAWVACALGRRNVTVIQSGSTLTSGDDMSTAGVLDTSDTAVDLLHQSHPVANAQKAMGCGGRSRCQGLALASQAAASGRQDLLSGPEDSHLHGNCAAVIAARDGLYDCLRQSALMQRQSLVAPVGMRNWRRVELRPQENHELLMNAVEIYRDRCTRSLDRLRTKTATKRTWTINPCAAPSLQETSELPGELSAKAFVLLENPWVVRRPG